MNIEFRYLYRDTGNWKKRGRAVFVNPDAFPVEKAQARMIAACERPLANLNWFVPERIGLEPLREGWDIDLDGPWHELSGDLSQTDDRPPDPRTLQEFLQDFEQAALEHWSHVPARAIT